MALNRGYFLTSVTILANFSSKDFSASFLKKASLVPSNLNLINVLKVLWDPANSLYCNEPAYPDGYEALQGGYLGHVHMKDAVVDIPKANLRQCEMGAGQMAPLFEPIAENLKRDGYDGVISLESVYRPDGGTYEDGFRASVGRFKALFA